MPKFYFDIIAVDGTVTRDSVGVELVDTEAAKAEAKRTLAEMCQEAVADDLSELRIEVRDEAGSRVAVRIASFDNVDANDSWVFSPPSVLPRRRR